MKYTLKMKNVVNICMNKRVSDNYLHVYCVLFRSLSKYTIVSPFQKFQAPAAC